MWWASTTNIISTSIPTERWATDVSTPEKWGGHKNLRYKSSRKEIQSHCSYVCSADEAIIIFKSFLLLRCDKSRQCIWQTLLLWLHARNFQPPIYHRWISPHGKLDKKELHNFSDALGNKQVVNLCALSTEAKSCTQWLWACPSILKLV